MKEDVMTLNIHNESRNPKSLKKFSIQYRFFCRWKLSFIEKMSLFIRCGQIADWVKQKIK